jgi:hypothetical protein
MQLRFNGSVLAVCASAFITAGALAQVTAAAGVTPVDDTPKINVGVTLFADYTFVDSPSAKDADNNTIHQSAFTASRAYINVTGNLNHWIGFRITPDVARETGSGASLSGSQELRLKYAFAQFNLDDWATKGSWVRLGLQQTPIIDYTEQIYRYRFQGTVFAERTGLLVSSDAGVSGRYVLPGNYGDLHGGFYNGEGYQRAETNNEKAVMLRGSFRPLPLGGIWKGLRVTGFLDEDHYVQGARRQRTLEQVTFEHPLVNAGFDLIQGKDRTSVTKLEADSKGWSAWATPKLGTKGWELLFRHDELTPNRDAGSQKQKRDIEGVAYWFQGLQKVTCALLLDRDSFQQPNFSPNRPTDTRYALKLLINY